MANEKKRTYGPGYRAVPEDESRCIRSVHAGGRHVHSNQCIGKRGHGKDGLYCQLHAKDHPTNDGETWYAVEVYLGDKIKPVTVTHSTDSFVWIKSGDRSRREKRENHYAHYFRTEKEAMGFALRKAEGDLKRAEIEVARLTQEVEKWRQKSKT